MINEEQVTVATWGRTEERGGRDQLYVNCHS